jgi:hypothetical protein
MLKNFKPRLFTFFVMCIMAASGVARAQGAFEDPGARSNGAAGDLTPVAEKIDAGTVELGATAQVVVLFRNDDSKPIKTGVINLYPSSNISAAVADNQCAASPLATGEVCAVSIQVKGLQQGNYRIEMLMRHEGRTKLLTSTINGVVERTGDEEVDMISDIEAIPSKVEFGDLQESRSQVKTVILRNKTSKPLTVKTVKIDAGSQSGYDVKQNCGELAVGAACIASVTWTPSQRGPSTGTLIVEHTGPTEIATVELTGSYMPSSAVQASIFPEAVPGKGLLVSSKDQIDFGSGVAERSSITVSLVNTGDTPLTLIGIRMSNNESGIRAEKTGCRAGSTLSPLEACPLTLTWEPVREGTVVDDIQISHSGARGILVLPIRGTAAKAINKDAKPINFGGNYGPEAIMNQVAPLSLDELEDTDMPTPEGKEKEKAPKPKTKPAKESSKEKAGAEDQPAEEETLEPVLARPQVDVRGILDGYTITSFSSRRAIISGPGGSRVVFDGEQTVIGGVLWDISMRSNAIEFRSGDQKVLLLFDRSLSSVNFSGAQSSGNAIAAPVAAPAATAP